jgi:SAM-dependent methyltransferase
MKMVTLVQMHACQLDPVFYRSAYEDVRDMTDQELLNHFHIQGKNEGRIGTPLSLRENFGELIKGCSDILEIGPFLFPVVVGPRVKYFDVLDLEGLRKRAAQVGMLVNPAAPPIDFVSPDGDLTIIDGVFDAVVSSHCVEHQPDLLKHFNDVARILGPAGKYAMLIPDKRYCFDHFIAETTIAQVLQAHAEQRRVHTLASVVEHHALITHNDVRRHWQGDHEDAGYRQAIATQTRRAIDEYYQAKGAYIDVHAWRFTPDSFHAVVAQLGEMGAISLNVDQVYCTPGLANEFIAVLVKA